MAAKVVEFTKPMTRRMQQWWLDWGRSLERSNLFTEARDAYMQVICGPDLHLSADAYNNMGTIEVRNGNHYNAYSAFRKAVRCNPNLALAQFNLGSVLDDQGKIKESIASYREALRINPQFADAWYNLAIMHAKREEHGKALMCYKEFLCWNRDAFDDFYRRQANREIRRLTAKLKSRFVVLT